MSRWIDADALEYDTEWSEYHDGFTAYSQMAIDTAPSIDIVRCRECKYSGVRNDADVECKRHKLIMRLNNFCSYGERNCSEKPNNSERSE